MTNTKKTAVILDGQAIAFQLKANLRQEISELGTSPGLAAILVGNNEASKLYLKLKEKASQEVGIIFHKYLCNSDCCQQIDEAGLLEMISFLNQDKNTNGIIVQLPLPAEFNQDKIIKAIRPAKDVDGFNGGPVIPPTVAAVIELLRATGETLNNKKTLIIGKTDIFTHGLEKYLASELNIKNTTINNAIPADSATYDVIIIALGQAHALQKNQVKPGAIIIDIGINKKNGETVGDVDPAVAEVAGYLSPVPGGVGPLTVACLLRNTLELHKRQNNL